jgi:preprotein translocase subunit SecA
VENYNFEIRKQLLEYDNVMNKQREVIYGLRRSILEGENLRDVIVDAVLTAGDDVVDSHYALSQHEEALNLVSADILSKFMVDITPVKEQLITLNAQQVKDEIAQILTKAYENKEAQVTHEVMRGMERMILLHVIDTKWKEHLHTMDQVKDGISLRALGQRDPLVEYKKEGFSLFKTMYGSINHEVASMIFRLQAMPQEMRPRSVFSSIPQEAVHQEFQGMPKAIAPQEAALQESMVPQQPVTMAPRSTDKVGRNDPCPCGSGKKYKKCCGA